MQRVVYGFRSETQAIDRILAGWPATRPPCRPGSQQVGGPAGWVAGARVWQPLGQFVGRALGGPTDRPACQCDVQVAGCVVGLLSGPIAHVAI